MYSDSYGWVNCVGAGSYFGFPVSSYLPRFGVRAKVYFSAGSSPRYIYSNTIYIN